MNITASITVDPQIVLDACITYLDAHPIDGYRSEVTSIRDMARYAHGRRLPLHLSADAFDILKEHIQ